VAGSQRPRVIAMTCSARLSVRDDLDSASAGYRVRGHAGPVSAAPGLPNGEPRVVAGLVCFQGGDRAIGHGIAIGDVSA
jgi:hypothetical protein